MISDSKRKDLYKQGYRLVGNHSAIKVCTWTKKSIRDEDVCYKSTFYDINTHRCVQMTPSLGVCTLRCDWCWRDIAHTKAVWQGSCDEPADIIDGCITEQVRYLQGFGGNKKTNDNKLKEAFVPKHFAISLSGEPTFYPKLPGLITELRKRNLTSFLVTNGTNPDMIKSLVNNQPTQLYITVPAPNDSIFKILCNPLINGGWERILKSMSMVHLFDRNVLRLTVSKGKNMLNAREYGQLIKEYKPRWVEVKAYMWVGYSRQRNTIENMPRHDEILKFSKEIATHSGYKLTDEKKESRVVLLS